MGVEFSTDAKGSCTVTGREYTEAATLFIQAAVRNAFHPANTLSRTLADEAIRQHFPGENETYFLNYGGDKDGAASSLAGVRFAAALALGDEAERLTFRREKLTLTVYMRSPSKEGRGSCVTATFPEENRTVHIEWDVTAAHLKCKNQPFKTFLEKLKEIAADDKKE